MLLRGCIGLLCISAAVAQHTICHDGWIPFKESCYLFHGSPMPFVTAEAYCRQHMESHLVHVETGYENNFLKEQMSRLTAQYWWVGITDEDVEGKWQWYGIDEDITFDDFQNGDAGDHHAEDCAEFAPVYHYAWADVECWASRSPVCETRLY